MLIVPPEFGPQPLNWPGTKTGNETDERCARNVNRTLSDEDWAKVDIAERSRKPRAGMRFTQNLQIV
jgi:hypothetical protein